MENELSTEAIPGDPNEERRARRQRVLMKGYVAYHGNYASIPCNIRNLSETGAMVVLEAPVAIPGQFTLFAELAGFKVDCEVAWQRGLAFGVRFISQREQSKIVRQQILGTSEKALSELTLRQMEMRDRREGRVADPVVTPLASAPSKPSFGRRVSDEPAIPMNKAQ